MKKHPSGRQGSRPVSAYDKSRQELATRYRELRQEGEVPSLQLSEFVDLADWEYSTHSIERALNVIEDALTLYPEDCQLQSIRGSYLVELGQTDMAWKVLEEITDQQDTDVRMLHATLLLEDGNLKEAMRILTDVDLEPIHPMEIAYVLSQCNFPNQALKMMRHAEQKEKEKGMENDENGPYYRRLKADILTDTGKFDEAIRLYEEFLDEDPYNAHEWYNLAECQIKMGDIGSAIDSLDFSLAVNPDNALAYQMRSECFLRLGNLEKGIGDADRALSTGGLDIRALTEFATQELQSEGQTDLALALIDHFVQKKEQFSAPDRAQLLECAFILRWDQDDLLQYEPLMDEAIRLDPDNPHHWYFKGSARLIDGDFKEGRKWYDRIARTTKNGLILSQLATMMMDFHHEHAATGYMSAAVRITPAQDLIVHNLASFNLTGMKFLNSAFLSGLFPDREIDAIFERYCKMDSMADRQKALSRFDSLVQDRMRHHRSGDCQKPESPR